MALTAKQQRFVTEYLVDLNATQAAIRAGYSERSARQIGEQNLSKHDIAAAVKAAQEKREERTGISQDWALERLKLEAEFAGDGASHSARVAALGLAMRHLGMMTEDAPHPARKPLDLSKIPDDLKRLILAGIRAARGAGGG